MTGHSNAGRTSHEAPGVADTEQSPTPATPIVGDAWVVCVCRNSDHPASERYGAGDLDDALRAARSYAGHAISADHPYPDRTPAT